MAPKKKNKKKKGQNKKKAAESFQESIAGMSINERNQALAVQQEATRTFIPGQPYPKEVRAALQMALEQIEEEDIAAGRTVAPPSEDNEPFANAPPSASTDQRVLRRQKIMLQRMRKKQRENRERATLATIDPAVAANCIRYNLSVNQLRAVMRVGLRLPHECREEAAAKNETAAIEEEDVLFEEGSSLEDMFSALRTDDKFMGR